MRRGWAATGRQLMAGSLRGRWSAAFPDGQSALNPTAAKRRNIAGTRWWARRYLDMTSLRHEGLQIA